MLIAKATANASSEKTRNTALPFLMYRRKSHAVTAVSSTPQRNQIRLSRNPSSNAGMTITELVP